ISRHFLVQEQSYITLPAGYGYSYQGRFMASREATLEYLTTTKIGEKRQLTVPKHFRKNLGLRTGAPFAVLRLGDGLVLLPEQQRFEHLCEQVNSALTGAALRERHSWRHCLRRASTSLRTTARSLVPLRRPYT